jgi:hypothetical protein
MSMKLPDFVLEVIELLINTSREAIDMVTDVTNGEQELLRSVDQNRPRRSRDGVL